MSAPDFEANEAAPPSPDFPPPPPPGAAPPPEWGYDWPAAYPPGMQPISGDSIPAAWGGVPPDAWPGYAPPEAWGGYAVAPPNCLPSEAPLDPQALEQWQQWQQWQQYEAAVAAQQQAAGLAMYQGHPYQQAPLFAISPPGPPHRAHQRRLARKPKAALPAEPSFGSNSDAEGGALLFSGEPSQVEVGEPGAGAAGGGSSGAQAGTPPSGRPPRPHRRSRSASGAVPSAAAPAAPLHRYPSVAYDRAPRPVQFKPYTFADYQQRGYDAKASPKFWTLGGLGPTHGGSSFASSTSSDGSEGGTGALQGDALWAAQQQKRERQQQFGQTVSTGGCAHGWALWCHGHEAPEHACLLLAAQCHAVHAMLCHGMPTHAAVMLCHVMACKLDMPPLAHPVFSLFFPLPLCPTPTRPASRTVRASRRCRPGSGRHLRAPGQRCGSGLYALHSQACPSPPASAPGISRVRRLPQLLH